MAKIELIGSLIEFMLIIEMAKIEINRRLILEMAKIELTGAHIGFIELI